MKKFGSLVVVAAFGVSSLVVPLVAPTTAEAYTRPGYNGKIVFRTMRDGNNDIYVMNSNGSSQTQLTNSSGWDWRAAWSPDGSKIVFGSDRDGNDAIYIMDADGSNQTRLTDETLWSVGGAWSPDGSKIAFWSDRDGNTEIYTMNADGSNQTRLTNASGWDAGPTWSPDGTKIAFLSYRNGHGDVYVMNADGSNQTRLTTSAGDDTDPSWSMDGAKIAFTSGRDGNNEIYVMNSDGSNQTRLTTSPDEYEYLPQLSPDGTKLAYVRHASDSSHSILVVSNADGTEPQDYNFRSYGVEIIDWFSWSPDSKHLLLTAYHEASYETRDEYIVTANGNTAIQLTTDGVSGYGEWLSVPNAPPIVNNDTLTVTYNTSGTADVLANDTDEEAFNNGNLNITVQPTNGIASVVDGKIHYSPNNGFQGSDSLIYQICDSFMLDQLCATGVLNITVQAPTAPALVISKVNGASFSMGTNSYVTSSLRPTFSGTATPGSEIRVEIHSDPIVLTTTADGDGNWSVTPGFDLPTGEHMVYISATLNGLTTELDSFGLSVGALASTGANLWIVIIMAIGAVAASTLMMARARQR